MIYSYIFGIILACVSYFAYQRYVNVYPSLIIKPDKRYDYIIAGAGTAGCVLASRLSEDPKNKVLLIEAGEHMGYFTKIPLTPTAAQQGSDDWSVRTAAQKFSSFGLWGQSQMLPRGKGLGGSGQINFLLHGFGLPEDYERWDTLGFKGWTFEDLKPYFIKAFGTIESEFDSWECSNCPGSKAPMKLKSINEEDTLMNTFRRASEEVKTDATVFRRTTATVKDGMRYASLEAYLKPAMVRKNLHVLLKTQAVSIRFENKTASSLFILRNHRELDNVFVNKEIILCTGAVKTPQLLLLSGIGPVEVLKKFRIPMITANEYVGGNLHDHMNMPLYVSVKEPVSVTLSKIFTFGTLWDYFWSSSGLLSFPPVAGVEYQNNSAALLFSMGSSSERLLRDLSNYKPRVYRDTFPFHSSTHKEGFMLLATCTQPQSRGFVSLGDTSTTVPAVVDPRYLELYGDVKCMIQAIRRIETLISTKAFQSIGATIHWPRPERCLSFWNYSSDDQRGIKIKRKRISKDKSAIRKIKIGDIGSPPDAYLECVIREVAVTGHHIGGTCAGGAVVDDELRVKHVSRLRIMDASVIPSPLSLFPNSVLIGMAEKAADMILNSLEH